MNTYAKTQGGPPATGSHRGFTTPPVRQRSTAHNPSLFKRLRTLPVTAGVGVRRNQGKQRRYEVKEVQEAKVGPAEDESFRGHVFRAITRRPRL